MGEIWKVCLISDVVKFSALSPTPPFPQQAPRLKLAALVTPLLFVSLFVNSAMFMKGTTFITGFVFFGQPVLTPGLNWLNKTIPNWQKFLEIRKYPLLRTLN